MINEDRRQGPARSAFERFGQLAGDLVGRRWALDTGGLDPAAASQTRTRVAIGASQAAGPREALAELGHLDANPARIDPIDVDGLAWRGMFRLVAGDLGPQYLAHLVGKGLSNPEIAAELFISRKAVEYHLGNIYAKCGVHGRQQLRRFVEQWRQPVTT